LLGDAPSVHLRKHDVEQDEIRTLVTRERKRSRAVTGLQRVEAGSLEVEAADQSDRTLVVDDENPAGACRRAVRALARIGEPEELGTFRASFVRNAVRLTPALAKKPRRSYPLRPTEWGDPRAVQDD
jgi:hypothetical protein